MENLEICKKCGGKCCKRYTGSYIPDDLFDTSKNITKDDIIEVLKRGDVAIDRWDADEDSDYEDLYFIRPRMNGYQYKFNPNNPFIDKEFLDLLSKSFESSPKSVIDFAYGGRCIHHTDDGCKLGYDKRPAQCRYLIPQDDHKCDEDENPDSKDVPGKLYYARKWLPYNEILKEISYMDDIDEIVNKAREDKD